jgi:(S)-2-hydroxy-acid oxidase
MRKFRLRARRLIDVRDPDTSTNIFGFTWSSPVALSPVGGLRKYHPSGEVAVAHAARAQGVTPILSTWTSLPMEDVLEANDAPLWFQLYPTNYWRVTEHMVTRAQRLGCPVVVVTVDRPAPSNPETFQRFRRADTTDCTVCHGTKDEPKLGMSHSPMYKGIDTEGIENVRASGLTWNFVDRLKSFTSMKVVLKGIVTAEDAQECLRRGVDGIIVSNHGGRSEASGRSTIESLPEVVTAADGRIPVLVDSGFRRGTDVFKALALGADAVCIGRPYVWGLSSFGQAGVERVLAILKAEFRRVMQEIGVTSVGEIGRSHIERA